MSKRTLWAASLAIPLILLTGCSNGGLAGAWSQDAVEYDLNHGSSPAEVYAAAKSEEPELAAEIGETGAWNVAATSCLANYENDNGSAAVEALVKPTTDEQHEQLEALRVAAGEELCPNIHS